MPNQGKRRGFAAMDPEKQRQIASKGGKAAHQKGTAHEFTPEEAREAGRKGGEAVSQDRRHMAEIGRKGGESSHGHAEARGKRHETYAAHGKSETRDVEREPGGENNE